MSFEKILEVMLKDKRVRLSIVKRSHKFFFYFYFPHYTEFEIAPFHEEIFRITQDTSIRNVVFCAFRGSAKSTLMALSFPLWAILGEQQIKYILVLSKTQHKAQTLLQHIKYEMETNELLKRDLGPFQVERNQWSIVSLYIQRYRARITAASAEQSIRGLRHMQYRPQLIITDDLEDMESVKTKEGREKLFEWLIGDVIPAGSTHTRLVVIGSLVYQDALMERLEAMIQSREMAGVYRKYPILDERGNPTWLGKFPNQKAIENERAKGITEESWDREYLLRSILNKDRITKPEWIQHYGELPSERAKDFRFTVTAIDLAISKNESADFTAMVSAMVFGARENLRVYILPNPVNERLSSLEAQERAELLSRTLGSGTPTKLIVENVAYQAAFIEMMNQRGIPTEGFQVQGNDKEARQRLAASQIQWGKVFFPDKGADALISQLLNFNFQRHDDLADAFAILILNTVSTKLREFSFARVDGLSSYKKEMQYKNLSLKERIEKDDKQFAEQLRAEELELFRESERQHLRRAKNMRFWED